MDRYLKEITVSSKLRIRIGDVEIDYEGAEDFLREQVPELLKTAHLTFVAKKETFSRQELLTEMQTASAYYKKSYSNNLSQTLTRAVADSELSETAKDSYALTASTLAELEGKIAHA